MWIRKRTTSEDEKNKSITTPSFDVISGDMGQSELCSWKRKKKRNKAYKRDSNGIRRDNETEILQNNSLLVKNFSTCPTSDVKSGTHSLTTPSCKRNRKNNVELKKEVGQPEMKNNVARVALPCYANEMTKECEMFNPAKSADISLDLEARCGPCGSPRNLCPLQSDARPGNGKMNEDDGVANVSSNKNILRTNKIRGIKTYSRRKKKVYDSLKVNSNSIQEDTITLAQSRMGNTSSEHSGDTLFGGCLKDVNKKMLVEGQGSLLQVVEDVRREKVTDSRTDQNEGRVDMSYSLAKSTDGFNMDKPLSEFTHYTSDSRTDNLEENIGNSNPNDLLAKVGDISSDEPVDGDSITLFSNLANSRNEHSQVNTDVNLSLGRSLIVTSRKKLLVLDLNGLIAEIIRYVPERHTPDAVISMRAVFKRPFYEDFLQFCFSRFSVGVWSSRAKSNVESIVDFLLGDAKQNLLFCWDQSHCTRTGFYTVENRHKPLLVKKIRKLWEKYEPDLPWEVGEYNEVNTVMLDDSPYKALLNPPHTAIFPDSYRYTNKADDSLGPGGELRIYLEGLASAENVQRYVKENPFGQRPITEKNVSWRFYQKVIEAITIEPGNADNERSMYGPDWGIQRSIGDVNSADKVLDNCPVSHDQSSSGLSNRNILCDTEGSDWRMRKERRRDWNSDYNAQDKHPKSYDQRASGFRDRYTFYDASRQEGRIRRWGGDWNRSCRDLDKRPVPYDQKDRSCRHLDKSPVPYDQKDRSCHQKDRSCRHLDKSPEYDQKERSCRHLDKSPVPYDQKGSGNSDRYSSYFDRKDNRSWGIQRGRGLDERQVSYDQKASRYSNRYSSSDTQGSDWSRGMQRGGRDRSRDYHAVDQRVSGYPCNSRYSKFSFHWQAYR